MALPRYVTGGIINPRTGRITYYVKRNGRTVGKGFKTRAQAQAFAISHFARTSGLRRRVTAKRRTKRKLRRRKR